MTLSTPFVVAVAAVVPILALIVIGRVRAYRRRAAQPEESAGYRFEPKAERTPSLFLRRFTLPQRTYLNSQFADARICFVVCTYILLVTAAIGLLPNQLHVVTTASYAQQVWARYQDQLTVAGYVAETLSFMIALIVVATLQSRHYANFIRTRPLSFRFLFWGRAFVALASLLAATQAAFLASILLVRFTYGPIWKLASVSLAPVFRVDLSMLTTTALIFSSFVFLALLPRRWSMSGKFKFIPVFLGAAFGSQFLHVSRFLLTTFAAKVLFLFPAQTPPQRYSYALVPLGCVVALLFLAERLSARFEI
jgi:hypothetical protein